MKQQPEHGSGGSARSVGPPQPQPVDSPHPRRWWVLFAIGVGTFMSALDGSVVNTILPLLRSELHATVAGIEWVTVVYLLVVSSLLLGVGRAGDLYGQKRTYLAGFVVFVLGSALCGASPRAEALVALRALQGVGAAMLFANAPAILTRTFPATERGRALGTQATMTYLGLTVGPTLGGWLAHDFGWRAVFYINVPIGLFALLLAWRVVPRDQGRAVTERFDYPGAALFVTGLVALLAALNRGHAWGWRAPLTLGLLALGAVLLVSFVQLERRRAHPLLDLALFRSRPFAASTGSALLNYMCISSITFVLPFLLIQHRGLDTQQTGLILTAQPLVMALVAPVSGALSDRIGSRTLATGGMLLLALGLALLALAVPAGSLGAIAGCLGVVGLGVGAFVAPNNSALMGAAPRHRQGIAAGVLATARNLGMVVGVGISGAVLTTWLAHAATPAAGLVHGVQAALLLAAALAAVGAFTSALR